jgi:hypothetical protein
MPLHGESPTLDRWWGWSSNLRFQYAFSCGTNRNEIGIPRFHIPHSAVYIGSSTRAIFLLNVSDQYSMISLSPSIQCDYNCREPTSSSSSVAGRKIVLLVGDLNHGGSGKWKLKCSLLNWYFNSWYYSLFQLY